MWAAVGKNLMPDRVVLKEHDDFAGRLNDLHGKGMKINAWQAGRSTGVVKRIVCFRQWIRFGSERRLGGFVLRLAPSGHGRLLRGELINPVPLIGSDRAWAVIEPEA